MKPLTLTEIKNYCKKQGLGFACKKCSFYSSAWGKCYFFQVTPDEWNLSFIREKLKK